MADHNINITIKDTSAAVKGAKPAGKTTVVSKIEPASIQKLTKAFQAAVSKSFDVKSLANSIASAIEKKLSSSMSKGAPKGVSKADVNRLVKQTSSDLAKKISQSLIKSLSQPAGPTKVGMSDKRIVDTLSGLDKHIQSAIGKLNTEIKKQTGKQLGPDVSRSIADAVTGSIEKTIPKSLDQATKDLSRAVSNIKVISKEISSLVNSIRKMRQSGGIDIGEIKPIINSLKTLTTEFKKLPGEIRQARESAKSVVKEEKQLYDNLSKSLADLRKSMRERVVGVRARAVEDPQKFARIIASELSKAVKDMPALKGTRIEKVLSDLDKKVAGIGDVAKAFKSVEKELKTQVKGGQISTKGFNSLLKTIENLNTNLRNLPKTIDVSGDVSVLKSLEAFTKRTDRFLKTLEKFSSEVDVKIDTKGIKKQIEDAVKEVKPQVEIDFRAHSRYLEKQIKNLGKRLKIETDPTEIIKLADTIDDVKSKLADLQREAGKPITVKFDVTDEKVAAAVKTRQSALTKPKPFDDKEIKNVVEDIDRLFNEVIKARAEDIKEDLKFGARTGESKALLTQFKEAYKGGDVEKLKKITTAGMGHVSKANKPLMEMGRLLSLLESMLGGNVEAIKESLVGASQATKKLEETISQTSKEIDGSSKEFVAKLGEATNSLASVKGTADVIQERAKNLTLGPVGTAKAALESYKIYKYPKKIIPPTEDIKFTGVEPGVKYGAPAKKAVEANIKVLGKSLKNLQEYIVGALERELASGRSGWEIVREGSEQAVDEYFKLATGGLLGNIKSAGKQWFIQIADIRKIRKRLESQGKKVAELSPTKVIDLYKESLISEEAKKPLETQVRLIGKWIKATSEEGIRKAEGLTEIEREKFVGFKKKYPEPEPRKEMRAEIESVLESNQEIRRVFKKTHAALEAERTMTSKVLDEFGRVIDTPLVKSIAIPAAKITEMGTAAFETAQGAERAIPKFAKFITGFEKLHATLVELGKIEPGQAQIAERIRLVGVKPKGPTKATAENLAEEMLRMLSTVPEKRGFVFEQYRKVAGVKGLEREATGVSTAEEFNRQIEAVINTLKGLPKAQQSIDVFMDAMDKMGISAYDVVKSLDELKFENIYDILGKVVEKHLTAVGQRPMWDRPIRNFESAVRELEQLLPLVEPGRPRRGAHQEAVVQLLTRTTPIYEDIRVELDEQKDLIKDINLRLSEMVTQADVMRKAGLPGAPVPETIRALSTLGVPESLAGKVEPMAAKGEYLGALNAVTMRLYTENLRELAPFGAQFQAWQRNISNVTNAMTSASKETAKTFKEVGVDLPKITTEFPTLRTEREREMIAGGRYGRRGYGMNVLAELRTTAGTFEDQVIISGKIADALTSVTRTLVRPTMVGRLSKEPRIDVSEIKAPKLLEKSIEDAAKTIQDVLGIKEEYKGRADKALIESVTKTISVVRGADVEVQAAKIAEVFLNYFGRKIVTRYGSKGVAVTPSNLREVLEYYGEKKMKVLPKAERTRAGLGIAVMPKSMGQLASEILSAEAEKLEEKGMDPASIKRLSTALVTSGNKFMLDMFKEAGVIAEDEIRVQKGIFTQLQNALKQLDIDLASDIEGIRGLKEVYGKKVGKELYVEKPIDIRISAAGAAKRGLQTEVLESVMANIIGAGPGGVTTMKTTLKPEVYRKMLAGKKIPGKAIPEPGMLSKYAEALGFEPAIMGKGREAAYQQLLKEFKEKFGEGKEDIAQRAAELEALSNFYVEVVDELNKTRKGLVGPKFVQVVEEPTLYPSWETKAIEKGIKGEKLDLPAFASYAAIFGEQSEFMKELKGASTIDTKEAWEYIRALQIVNKQNMEVKKTLLESVQPVDLLDIKSFEESTGTLQDFKNTILDIQKYPAPFKVKIPATEKGAEEPYEEFYVPGALARGTYEEPLVAGERAPKALARRLMHVINMAKEVEMRRAEFATVEKQIENLTKTLEVSENVAEREELTKKIEDLSSQLEDVYGKPERVGAIKENLKTFIGGLRKKVQDLAKTGASSAEMWDVVKQMMGGLSREAAPAAPFRVEGVGERPEIEHVKELINREKDAVNKNIKTSTEAYTYIASAITDMLIGVSDATESEMKEMQKALTDITVAGAERKPKLVAGARRKYGIKAIDVEGALKKFIERRRKKLEATKAGTGLERAAETGKLATFAESIGATVGGFEADYDRDLAKLARAKIDYYNELAKAVLGKRGAVAEALFSRKIPAIMGKAISAIVDKTEELQSFSTAIKEIKKISEEYGLDRFVGELDKIAEGISDIEVVHRKNIEKYKRELKLPVLKQYELGVPPEYAKKIPVKFEQKFEFTKGMMPIRADMPEKKESLYELLKYEEKLRAMVGILETNVPKTTEVEALLKDIKRHIEEDLYVYIESVRYPFTGVSSVQPYKPKLMKGALAAHALAVPGMPEMDLEKFEKQIEKVMSVREKLEKERDAVTDDEIGKRKELTAIIERLDRAISDVLPKYIAHQQKLDFDGDTIEIHSATTKQAREDIKKHFDSLTKDIDSTAAVFRDFFTYEARQLPTGEYPLGEMVKAFEKKFPAEKGFGFMRMPYLTKELEYMPTAKQLEVLAGRPKAMPAEDILKSVVREVIKAPEEQTKLLDMIDKDINAVVDAIENLGKGSELSKQSAALVKEGIKTRTFEEKYKDALEAQLYKIHTGPETEQLYRLIRLVETSIGFAGGRVAPGQVTGRATAAFKERWPAGAALGIEPVAEFQTMINELLRFGIQKGMDVKHAGEFPVAGEVVRELSKGEKAAENLFDRIVVKNEDAFKDLKDFAEQNEKAIRRRLGRLSTREVREEAVKLRKARGMETGPAEREMPREKLVGDIVEMVGFKGFLTEVAKMVREEAIAGLIKETKALPPRLQAKKMGGATDIRAWARSIVEDQMEEGGINIRKLITTTKQPLYMKRVFGAEPKRELGALRARGEKVMAPEFEFGGMSAAQQKQYIKKYQETQATAINLARELESATQTMGGGAYAEMVSSALQNIYSEQDKINKLLMTLQRGGFAANVPDVSVVERVLKGTGIADITKELIDVSNNSIREMQDELKSYSELVGLPPLTNLEKFEIEAEARKKFSEVAADKIKSVGKEGISAEEFDKEIKKITDTWIAKAEAIIQMDKIIAVLKTKKYEENLLLNILPSREAIEKRIAKPIVKPAIEEVKLTEAERRARIEKFIPRGKERVTAARSMAAEKGVIEKELLPRAAKDCVPITNCGKPLEVYVVNLGDVGQAKALTAAFKENIKKAVPVGGLEKQFDYLTKMASAASKGLNELKGATYETMYRASALTGGGRFEQRDPIYRRGFSIEQLKKSQLQGIMEEMLGLGKETPELEASAFLGTALHSKVEQQLKKKLGKGVETEKFVKYEDETVGIIVGHIDAILKDAAGNIEQAIDIKTSSKGVIDELGRGIVDLDEAMSKATSFYTKQKIQNAVSQINFYIAALAGQEGVDPKDIEGVIKFYDRLAAEKGPATVKFKFDPERLQRDLEAVAKARELIQKYIIEENPVKGVDVVYKKAIENIKRSLKGKKPEYAPTASIEELEKINKDISELTDKQIKEFMSSATEYYKRIKGGARAARPAKRAPISPRESIITERERVLQEKRLKEATESRVEFKEFTVPPKMAAGDLNVVYESLLKLHEQARYFQEAYSKIDFESVFKTLHKDVQDILTEAAESGRAGDVGPKLVEILNRLQEEGTITQSENSKIWKMYRLAVGDFYIKQAAAAKKLIEDAKLEQDIAKGQRGYAQFKSSIDRFREYIIDSLGKATDIYTFKEGTGRKFWTPELARAAEVYMPPEEITKRAAGPLGGDEKLLALYKDLVKDIAEGETLKPPIFKARDIITSLTNINDELINLGSTTDSVARRGKELIEAWDFEGLVGNVTRLRAALQKYLRFNLREDFTVEQRKNLEDTLKYLRQIETTFSKFGKAKPPVAWGETGVTKVLPWLDPKAQRALHMRNVAMLREYFKKAEEAGGPKTGERFTYMVKILDQTGNVLKNTAYDFHKYGEFVDRAGDATGAFGERQRDLMVYTQGANRTFRAALRRVTMWGAAATIVYGGISQLKNMIGTLADVEMGVAQLRMVMSPLETDFMKMQKAAVGFAKQYGVPITDVLKGMRIFAQQGLKQEEVIDRTRVATLAANVSTLNAKDATEAITAASKVFRQEGESTLKFIDAWSEVEAKHAITSEDMALALRKAASAGKNAGFTFDELNGVVASIGSVTRQTGREVGTSLRFIFRRLATEKGPKELAKLGIPVLTETGELRRGYDILMDLSKAWRDLTSAQKMSIAQAIGGTRQYNQLLVLMDNWEEAVSATRDSINSKGSAERRNLEVMKTYTKQLEQTKQAAVELQIEFGKVYLPIAKFGLKGLKFLLESLSAIPISAKAAAVGLSLLVTYIAKGESLITSLSDSLGKGSTYISDFFNAFKRGVAVSAFEVFGKGMGPEFKGLKKIGEGKSIRDFRSALGKTAYMLSAMGTTYNQFVGDVILGSGKAASAVGKTAESVGKSMSSLNKAAIESYGGYKGVMSTLTEQGFKGLLTRLPKMLGPIAVVGTEVAAQSTEYAGKAIDKFGKKMGGMGQSFLKDWASQNTGFVKATAPMIASMSALVPAFKAVYDYYGKTTKSAQDYEKSVYGIRRANESELNIIRDLIKDYDTLSGRLEDIRKAAEPEVKARRIELGTYEAPLLTLSELQQDATATANKLAETNVNLVAGYDKLGNAVLKTVGDFKEYLKTIEKLKVKEMAKTEVNVLDKYIRDLTEIEGPEKWKYELKKLLKEAPVFGEIIGRHIRISPAKALDEVTKRLNALINLKTKYPISTAFDKDIKKYQTSLKEVRKGFASTYQDFRKVLSEIPTEGLGRDEIAELLGREELRKGYGLMVDVEPRFRLVPNREIEIPDPHWRDIMRTMKVKTGVKWQDVLGAEVMRRIFPQAAPVLDVSSVLTKARIETKGIKPRMGKALSGDILTFLDEVIYKYNMAGQQAVLSLKETSDGIFEWMVTYFNTKTFKVEERPFTEDMMKLVDNIFPQKVIEEDLTDRIQSFNEFVAGAAAGLRGVSAKDFKRDFALGERFFAEIPTTTILQGPKGYVPRPGGGAFGESPFQAGWQETTEEFFFKPMREYRMKVEQLEKLRLEGLEGETTVATGLYESLTKLQEVLKNNQVVLQYRAVFVDLTKTIEQATRAMRENLAVEKSRVELETAATGYMKGIPEGLENISTGVQRFRDLTARQRALIEEPGTRRAAVRFRAAEIRRGAAIEQVYAIDRALVALESIREVSKGFGAAMSPEEMRKYVEIVATGGDTQQAELLIETHKVTENTSETVDRLDKILENMGDEAAVEEMLSKFTDTLQGGLFRNTQETLNAMERVARIREKYEKKGNNEVVMASNKTLDILSKNLVEQVGFKKGMDKVDSNFTVFRKRFTAKEFAQRAFGGEVDLKVFVDKMSKEVPEIKKSFIDWDVYKEIPARPAFAEQKEVKKLLDLQRADNKTQLVSSKTLIKAGAAITAFEHFNKSHSNDVIKNLEDQLNSTAEQIKIANTEGRNTDELSKKMESVKVAIKKERERLDFHKMVQAISAVSTGTLAFAKALGLTEGQIKILGAGAISTYAAVKLASTIMGTEIPDSAREFEKSLKEVGKKIVTGEKIGWGEARKLRSEGKEYVKAYHEELKRSTNVTSKEFKKSAEKYIKDIPEDVEAGAKKVRAKATTDEDVKRLRQLLLTYATATMAGYVAEMSGEKTRLATLNKLAEEQAEIFVDIVEKYPEAAEKVIRDMRENADNMIKEGKRIEVPTETKSLVLDTEKARKEVKKNMELLRGEFKKAAEKSAEDMKKSADDIARSDVAKQFKSELDEMVSAVNAIKLGATLREKLEVETAGLLAGRRRPAPIDFGIRAITEMKPEEYLVYQKGPIEAFRKIGVEEEARTAAITKLIEYTGERSALGVRRGFFGGGLSAGDEERYDRLGDAIDDLEDEIEDLTNSITEAKKDIRLDVVEKEIELFEKVRQRDYEVAKAVRDVTREITKGKGLLGGGPAIPSIEVDFGPQTFKELTAFQVAMQTALQEKRIGPEGVEIVSDAQKSLEGYNEALERQISLQNHINDLQTKITTLEVDGTEDVKEEVEKWRDALGRAKSELKELDKTLEGDISTVRELIEGAKQLQREREKLISSLARIEEFNIERYFGNIPTILNKALKGFTGELQLPPTRREFTPQQMLFVGADKALRDSLTSYAINIDMLKAMSQEISKVAALRRDATDIINAHSKGISINKETVDAAKKAAVRYGLEINNLIDSHDILRKSVETTGNAIRKATDFMGLLKSASDSFISVSVSEMVEGLKGVKEARIKAGRLYGGGGPEAAQMITPLQELMGQMVGVQLDTLKATKYDVRKAELRERIYGGGLGGMELYKAQFELANLEELRRREIEASEQQYENRKILRQKDTFEQRIHDLMMYKQTHDLTVEQSKSINNIIGSMSDGMGGMLDMNEKTTKEAKLAEIDRLKSITTDEGKLRRLEEDRLSIVSAGAKQFAGLYGEQREKVREAYLESEKLLKADIQKLDEGVLKNAVSDPIIQELSTQTKILTEIAEKWGISREGLTKRYPDIGLPERTFEPPKRPWWALPRPKGSALAGAYAPGGRVFGEGGPKEDKVRAWVSPGEYVIKQASARKLGYDRLNYMNEKGRLPGFKNGGLVDWAKEDEERAKKYGRITAEPKKGIGEKVGSFLWEMVPFHQYMTKEGRMLTAALPAEAKAQQKTGEFMNLLDFMVGGEAGIQMIGKKTLGKTAGFIKKTLASQRGEVDITDLANIAKGKLSGAITKSFGELADEYISVARKEMPFLPEVVHKVGSFKELKELTNTVSDVASNLIKRPYLKGKLSKLDFALQDPSRKGAFGVQEGKGVIGMKKLGSLSTFMHEFLGHFKSLELDILVDYARNKFTKFGKESLPNEVSKFVDTYDRIHRNINKIRDAARVEESAKRPYTKLVPRKYSLTGGEAIPTTYETAANKSALTKQVKKLDQEELKVRDKLTELSKEPGFEAHREGYLREQMKLRKDPKYVEGMTFAEGGFIERLAATPGGIFGEKLFLPDEEQKWISKQAKKFWADVPMMLEVLPALRATRMIGATSRIFGRSMSLVKGMKDIKKYYRPSEGIAIKHKEIMSRPTPAGKAEEIIEKWSKQRPTTKEPPKMGWPHVRKGFDPDDIPDWARDIKTGEGLGTLVSNFGRLKNVADFLYGTKDVKKAEGGIVESIKRFFSGKERSTITKRLTTTGLLGKAAKESASREEEIKRQTKELCFAEGGFIDKIRKFLGIKVPTITEPEDLPAEPAVGSGNLQRTLKEVKKRREEETQQLKELGFAEGGVVDKIKKFFGLKESKPSVVKEFTTTGALGQTAKKALSREEEINRQMKELGFANGGMIGGLKRGTKDIDTAEFAIKTAKNMAAILQQRLIDRQYSDPKGRRQLADRLDQVEEMGNSAEQLLSNLKAGKNVITDPESGNLYSSISKALYGGVYKRKEKTAAGKEKVSLGGLLPQLQELRTALEKTKEKKGIIAAADITKYIQTEMGKFKVPEFKVGTPSVPEDMLAFLHKGEAVIPEHLNKPVHTDFASQFEKLIDKFEKTIEDAEFPKLEVNELPKLEVDELPKLEVGDLPELTVDASDAVSKIENAIRDVEITVNSSTRAVGAEKQLNKLECMIEDMNDKIYGYVDEKTDEVRMLNETSTDRKLGLAVSNLTTEINKVKTDAADVVSSVIINTKQHLETKIDGVGVALREVKTLAMTKI